MSDGSFGNAPYPRTGSTEPRLGSPGSPVPGGSGKFRDEKLDLQTFFTAFSDAFPSEYASEYANSFARQAINPEAPIELTSDELRELGVRIGHRDAMQAILADMRRGSDEEEEDEDDPTMTDGHALVPFEIAPEATKSDLSCTKIVLAKGDEWVDWSGSDTTLEAFTNSMKVALASSNMPNGFMRMFLDNKPLPFIIQLPTTRGRMVTGMLLRVPLADILEDDRTIPSGLTTMATTLHDLANRLIIIYKPGTAHGKGRLLTFRKDKDVSCVVELKAKYRDDKVASHTSLTNVTIRLLRDSMSVFRDVLSALQQELEVCASLPDSYRPREVVKTMSRVQRQAGVMGRCLAGNEKVLKFIAGEGIFGNEFATVLSLVEDLKVLADELQSNANDMLNLRLAMIDFKTQMNMKLFTYVTIVIAPMGLITGWFGMNFDEMKELHIDGFYYGVVAVALFLMLAISVALFWLNRERSVSLKDREFAEVVLSKAEGDHDE